ncbi:DUF58 domain-containing protein [Xylanimonas oleitrophica]|uniref:DUF58 domain-containing protein n=1 Tax=Xylanimonas oleitrophica TaxID=2607479 RepID=UPI0024831EF7|nr:DUF58 domain-containing protein [Xylanimonas oleitrophica]
MILLTVGLLLSRPDVALLGVPLVLAPTLGRTARPTEPTTADLEAPATTTAPGEAAASLLLRPAPGTDVVRARVTAPGHRPADLLITGRAETQVPLHLSSVRTGPWPTFRADLIAHGTHGASSQTPTTHHAPDTLVLPQAEPLGRVPLSPRLRGLTGPRTSRRTGDGSELRDIHPITPGDPARRIDWRATARRSPHLDELYVRRTHAGAEATAVLVVDSRDDVGPDLHTWRGTEPQRVDEPTSLDLARHAAASVATALVETGTRVGLEDLGRRSRPLAPATGHRHLRRLTHALALAAPTGTPARRLRPPQLPADAIVYLFTTLLDDEPVRLADAWTEHGTPVVVIDTLPHVRPVPENHLRTAWQITAMERTDRVRALEARAVPVLPWAGHDRAEARRRLEALVRRSQQHRPSTGVAR